MGVWEMEGGFELGLGLSGADLFGRGPTADEQGDGINEKGFTSPRLPGQDDKPGLELKTELLNEREIDNAQLGEHCGRWLLS